MLRIYYELNLFEQARYLVEAYIHNIMSSNNIIDELKKSPTNYLNYYLIILKLKTNPDLVKKGESLLIKKQIEKEKNMIHKFWLTEKLKELVGKKRIYKLIITKC